jgi:hypothetical protein
LLGDTLEKDYPAASLYTSDGMWSPGALRGLPHKKIGVNHSRLSARQVVFWLWVAAELSAERNFVGGPHSPWRD